MGDFGGFSHVLAAHAACAEPHAPFSVVGRRENTFLYRSCMKDKCLECESSLISGHDYMTCAT